MSQSEGGKGGEEGEGEEEDGEGVRGAGGEELTGREAKGGEEERGLAEGERGLAAAGFGPERRVGDGLLGAGRFRSGGRGRQRASGFRCNARRLWERDAGGDGVAGAGWVSAARLAGGVGADEIGVGGVGLV